MKKEKAAPAARDSRAREGSAQKSVFISERPTPLRKAEKKKAKPLRKAEKGKGKTLRKAVKQKEKRLRFLKIFARGRLLTVSARLPARNVEVLLSRLSLRKIPVLGLKSTENGIKLKVRAQDYPSAFAIFKQTCYTVGEERLGGILAPCVFALQKIGVTCGVLLFFLLALLSRPYILRVEYRGSAAFRAEEMQAVLYGAGVAPCRAVNGQTLKAAERELLLAFPSLWFVSLEKRGFYLTVTAEAAPLRAESEPCYLLTAPKSGVIQSLTVLQGVPLVRVGESVSEGQAIVRGALLSGAGDSLQETAAPVIAEAVLACEYLETRVYASQSENLLRLLSLNALKSVGAAVPLSDRSRILPQNGEYLYEISFTYLTAVTGGNPWKKGEEE